MNQSRFCHPLDELEAWIAILTTLPFLYGFINISRHGFTPSNP
jgi:hypothetical protein